MAAPAAEQLDPKRWFAASVAIVSVAIPVLDNTILNLAVPTILREFDTQLSSLQWVITGYSLTFATLLIIGGRLGDIYGHRRMFVLGASVFAAGSLLASISHSVPTLFVGEALIEGIGASMMIPATLSILTTTFQGAERAKAFAAWGAVAGAAVAFGPIVGGFLTTTYSWRWAFRINVIIAPILVIGALVSMHPDVRSGKRPHLDVRGSALIAIGSFSLIFGLSEGTIYGWWKPIKDLVIAGRVVWPTTMPISIIPLAFLLSFITFTLFVIIERAMERAAPRSAVRVRSAAPPGLPLRAAHHDGARDRSVRAAVHPPGAAPERRAPHRVAHRRMDAAPGNPDRDRRARSPGGSPGGSASRASCARGSRSSRSGCSWWRSSSRRRSRSSSCCRG